MGYLFKEQFNSVKELNDSDNIYLDYKYIGSLDKIIIDKQYNENNKLESVILNNSCKYKVFPYKNELPLILDLIKKYFYISRTKYDIVYIDKSLYYIFENDNSISLSYYLSKLGKCENYNIKESVKRILAFNWLMCIKNGYSLMFEDDIIIKSDNKMVSKIEECDSLLYCYSYNENDFVIVKNGKSDIPKNALNKWFDGSLEEFYKVVKSMIQGIEADFMRSKILDIVNEYNNDYVVWVNAVYERFRFIKNLKL